MKTTVEIGYGYALRSEMGGEVTNSETGKTLETLEPNKQVHMTAQESEWIVPDDCQVTKMRNFNHALAALGLLGGGDKLPAGYTRLEFLESTGEQWLSTGIVPTNKAGFRVRLSGPLNNSTTDTGFLLGTQNEQGKTRFYLSYTNKFNAGFGSYNHPVSVTRVENEWAEVNYKSSGLFSIGGMSIVLPPLNFTPLYEFLLFKASYLSNTPSSPTKPIRIFEFELTEGEQVACKMLPAIDPAGVPCMYDLVSKQAFHNKGSGRFTAGIKDAAQLRAVLRKLPDLTGQDMGTLTLSIPAEANTPEMQELLDTTESQKNWELTIQERAAVASTYSLRRVRKVVWVRRVPDKNGSYVDADGSRWHTEWCSAIYSPRGNDPTLHGYEPFDSEEQAAEQWGLVPYVEPETEENAD